MSQLNTNDKTTEQEQSSMQKEILERLVEQAKERSVDKNFNQNIEESIKKAKIASQTVEWNWRGFFSKGNPSKQEDKKDKVTKKTGIEKIVQEEMQDGVLEQFKSPADIVKLAIKIANARGNDVIEDTAKKVKVAQELVSNSEWVERQMNLIDEAKLVYQKFYGEDQLLCCDADEIKADECKICNNNEDL